jgi:hypothetical protein
MRSHSPGTNSHYGSIAHSLTTNCLLAANSYDASRIKVRASNTAALTRGVMNTQQELQQAFSELEQGTFLKK